MKHLTHLTRCSVCLVVFCFPVFAQNIQNPQSSVDNLLRGNLKVDPSTGAMQLQIPLGQYPGRGQATLPVTLNYSSKVWNIKHHSTSPCNGEPVSSYRTEFAKGSASGWTSTLGWFLPSEDLSLETYEGLTGKPAQQGNPTLFRIMRKFVRLPDGSRHEVRKDDARHSLSDSLFGMYYAVDGSRIMYDLATNTTFLPDGSRIVVDNSSGSVQYIDRNGNFMNYTSGTWTDTLGRTFGVPIPGSAPAAGDVVYTLPGGLTYTFRWRNLADALTDPTQPLRFPGDALSANCTLGSPQPGTLFSTQDANNKVLKGVLFNPVVLWQISLPNNTNYTFTYNVYGEMDKIVYPTSGSETFTYGFWEPLGGQLDDGTYSQANRGVNSRVISDGVMPPQVWTYGGNNFEPGVDSATDVRIVTAPNGTVTKTWYYISRGTQIKYGFDDARTGMVREERVYNSSGTMLRRTVNQLVMDGPQPGGYPTATRNARITKTVEIILDTGGNALASATEMTYDADLNITSTRQYDFVEIAQATAQTSDLWAIPNGTLIRTLETDYLTGDANYRARNLLTLPIATRVRDGIGNIIAQRSIAYDEPAFPLLTYGPLTGWSDPGVSARGNATSSSDWLNTTGANLSSHTQYDQCGNVRKAWDARDTSLTNPAQIEYSAAHQRAYPTLNTSPDPDAGGPLTALVTSTEYDGATGLVTSTIDANGQQTTFSYNDPLLRLKQVIRAVGDATAKNQITYIYDDIGRTVTVTSDLNSFEDNVLKSVTLYDALGRRVESRTYEGGTNFIASQMQYDTMGRADKKSNPFRPGLGESAVWTTTVFDALSRVLTVTTPDNAVVTTSYSGNTITVTDPTGKAKKSVTDALGRLVQVYEDPAGLNYQTTYIYDVLNNLSTVIQGTQTRTFVYDSLKRLTSTSNPESGTSSFQYDNNGNLTQKTDARGVVSTYAYDALNRNTTVDYSDTSLSPDVNRFYDGAVNGKGYFWHDYSGGIMSGGQKIEHRAIDVYDAMGRPKVMRQLFMTNGAWDLQLQISRTYNVAGRVLSQTYPSGRSVSYAYDSAGRTNNFTGTLGDGTNRTYSTGILYSSFGGMTKEQFGTNTAVYNKLFYNSRGQLSEIRVSTSYTGPTDTSWNRGAIINHYSGQCWGACNGTDNNGNLRQQDHWIPDANGGVQGLFVQNYDYDSLNRLLRVRENSWQQEFVYDRWGNRTIHQTNTWGMGINRKSFAVNTSNNRLEVPGGQAGTMAYDAVGNLITDTYSGYGTSNFDAQNRITSIQDAWGGWSYYTYDADGRRTRKKINNQETRFVYGFENELLAEYAGNGTPSTPQKEYGYRNGQLLVTASPSGCGAGYQGTKTWSATSPGIYHLTGQQEGSDWAAYVANHSAHAMVYGPYDTSFGGGHHQAQFLLQVDNTNGSDVIATLDIATGSGANVLAQRQIRRNDFAAANQWQWFTVEFDNPCFGTVEARIWWHDVANLKFRQLKITSGSPATIQWMIADQLGTPRMVLDQTGSLSSVKRHDYLPFGEELFGGTVDNPGPNGRTTALGYEGGDGIRQQFTSKERDVETGLDYFVHRYYSSSQGRFTSVDPTLVSANGLNPQTWNRYSYVTNRPLGFVDPFGLWGYIIEDIKNKEGKVTGQRFIFVKTKPDDNAASLLKQLGYETGTSAGDKLLKSIEKQLSQGETVQGSKLAGVVGRVFKVVDEGLSKQATLTTTKDGGPVYKPLNDCSMTTFRSAFPVALSQFGGAGLPDFDVDAADALLTSGMNVESPRSGDIVRYGKDETVNGEFKKNHATHFMSTMFTGDDGVTQAFSRSGVNGKFEIVPVNNFNGTNYGQVQGKKGDKTGFYRPPF